MPSDLFDPPQTELVSESLYEHLELAHYVEIFRGSADRVRYVIFVIIVFSIVILVAQWNTTDLSWVPQRYRKLNELYDAVRRMPEPAADERVRKQTRARFLSRDDLKENLSEYRKLRVEHVFLVQMPGMGATFDINDLGLFSGITYVLLLLLLLFSLMREHENLYLALFKVRRLHDRPGTIADGESTANYLYHSLAMSQVLSSPPTLAQWRPSSFKIAQCSLYRSCRSASIYHLCKLSNAPDCTILWCIDIGDVSTIRAVHSRSDYGRPGDYVCGRVQ